MAFEQRIKNLELIANAANDVDNTISKSDHDTNMREINLSKLFSDKIYIYVRILNKCLTQKTLNS